MKRYQTDGKADELISELKAKICAAIHSQFRCVCGATPPYCIAVDIIFADVISWHSKQLA